MTQPQLLEDDGLRVFNFAQKVLSFVNDAALEGLVTLPSRQYVTTGATVYDCEQTAVTVVSLNTGLPGRGTPGIPTSVECSPIWSVILEIAIVRCGVKVNTNGIMTPAKISEATMRSSRDVQVLMETLSKLSSDPQNIADVSGSITTQAMQGELIGTITRITAALP